MVNDSLVELTDTLATFADILGAALPGDAGEDSISFLPGLVNPNTDTGSARTSVLGAPFAARSLRAA